MTPAEAFTAYHASLLGYAFNRCGNLAQAEEAVSEAYARLLSAPSMNGATKSWLFKVTHSLLCQDWRRKDFVSLDDPDTFVQEPAEPRDFTNDLAARMEWEAVIKAVERLTEEDHKILARRLRGRSCQGTAGSRLFKARYDLTRLLTK